jgi:hypothetical protein
MLLVLHRMTGDLTIAELAHLRHTTPDWRYIATERPIQRQMVVAWQPGGIDDKCRGTMMIYCYCLSLVERENYHDDSFGHACGNTTTAGA